VTRGEKLAYARGYSRCRSHGWPAHKPPTPPHPLVAALLLAARSLRDAVDTEMATFDPEDPVSLALYEHVDKVDHAATAISAWLRGEDDEL
jgi:hypothetical protein